MAKKVLLAGQQNAGKSTIFNMLTGARQHVANYPGVTVDKKSGYFSAHGDNFQVIDLPGTYSLTSFSLEERVARKALREENADAVLNVMDAANLERSLHLTLQLAELQLPMVVVLNMMDVAKAEGISIDTLKLSSALNLPVTDCIGRLSQGREAILAALPKKQVSRNILSYPEIEPEIRELEKRLQTHQNESWPNLRWISVRLLEGDKEVIEMLASTLNKQELGDVTEQAESLSESANQRIGQPVKDYIISQRHVKVRELVDTCVTTEGEEGKGYRHISDKIDKFVLNRFGAPIFLLATVFIIYQCSIVYGYELTNYWWPYLASMRELVAGILPDAGFLYDPYTRSLGLWVIDSANTLLNYIPIFLILFAMIAILEDSGYMARIAFVSDRVLSAFGLHGQSTLPLILAGVFAGGCAVPGVMATKGIPDNRARLATIMTVPFMNCLAKVPLYTLLLGVFFVEDKALMMFYISTFSIIAALLVAKLLTKTVLQRTETAPFVMELPRYHMPTLRSVLTRSVERTWIYVRKVGTIVLAVSTVIFVLLQFPGVPDHAKQGFEDQAQQAVSKFEGKIKTTSYAGKFDEKSLPALVNYYADYKRAKLNAKGREASKAVNEKFKLRNEDFFSVVVPTKGDKEARKVNKALRKLSSDRKKVRRKMNDARLEASLLGQAGKALEPVTKYAGFDWKINIALFSSFAARESSVATLGVLFQQDDDSNAKLEERMQGSTDFNSHGALAAVALILFFILYPPCLATVMMIKVQTGEYRWMLLSIFLPTVLGFAVATAVFSLGSFFAISAIGMMTWTYFIALGLLLVLGLRHWMLTRNKPEMIPVKNL
ncbi:ferrous iron transport protein B [Vibrio sonorensis]|uniref:ferrous iron transport protein B n=1 Tax=Vibrio sonorensis TaxID=1004316 RepID=UPI0008D999DA|nr:ferrous iron transport protein B [Vibrio sonorensis]